MKRNQLLFLLIIKIVLSYGNAYSQITLTHNIGNDLLGSAMFSCNETEYWARVFVLSDFGITTQDEFIISSGQFGISSAWGGSNAQFNIYAIDSNFPNTFSESNIIGSSQVQNIPFIYQYGPPQLITINFDEPVKVPANVEIILVEVKKGIIPNTMPASTTFIARTEEDNDFSWYKGCVGINMYTSTIDLLVPKPNAKFYITVNGTINNINYNNNCLGDETQFNITYTQPIDSIIWDFGDGNSSTLESPVHNYNSSGNYIVSVTVVSGANFSTNSLEITIHEPPIVNYSNLLKQCDDDLDGYSSFNLTEVNSEISLNYQNEFITFYENQQDAELGVNVIPNSTNYINKNVSVDTVWARVENIYGCFRTSQVNLAVSTTQIPDTYTKDFYECDDGLSINDGIANFDFSSVDNEIQSMFPIGQNLIINYYRNITDALSENNPIIDISSYQNIGYPDTQNIYIRVDSALDNDCLGLGHYITLHVETVPVAHDVPIFEQCDDDGDSMFAFDTSTVENIILDGQTEVIVSYIDENGNNLPSPLPNPFVTDSQIVIAKVTNATSQDPDEACFDETQIAFIVHTIPVAYPVPDFIECDTDNDSLFSFDTSNIETTVLNGQTSMNVSYIDENGDDLPSPLPNPFSTRSQTITVKVENSLTSTCYDETNVSFVVSEQPIAYPISNEYVCDDISNDGEHTFILSSYNSQILNGQSSSIFEIKYFHTLVNAESNQFPLPNTYIVNSTSQPVFARIQNSNNNECYDITSFELGVHYLPIANKPQDLLVCDNENNDGTETFDLSLQNDQILNGQSDTGNRISYHLSMLDAQNDVNPLKFLFNNLENPQTVYVRLENVNFQDCFTINSFQIFVMEKPYLTMSNQWAICDESSVEIIADSGYDEYIWSTGETSESIFVDNPGDYEITVVNNYGNIQCEYSKTISVIESRIAIINSIEIEDWTQNDNTISIFVEGTGVYEYSIDGQNYQDKNEFFNLPIDDYIVYVRDKNGCGITTDTVYLMYYPNFFTPNDDGYNDRWQIINSEKEPNNKVYIYDRFGKLIAQLSSIDEGWDGLYNGSQMPSSDYWFVVFRENGKTYKGHFTLKR